MNIESVKIQGEGYSAVIDGVNYSSIHEGSRFWPGILEWIAAGNTPESEFTQEQIETAKISDIEQAIQQVLNEQAQSMGYDSIFTAVTYADESTVLQFQTEGQALRAWRSQVWSTAYNILADWKGGIIPEPTKDEVLAALPTFTM